MKYILRLNRNGLLALGLLVAAGVIELILAFVYEPMYAFSLLLGVVPLIACLLLHDKKAGWIILLACLALEGVSCLVGIVRCLRGDYGSIIDNLIDVLRQATEIVLLFAYVTEKKKLFSICCIVCAAFALLSLVIIIVQYVQYANATYTRGYTYALFSYISQALISFGLVVMARKDLVPYRSKTVSASESALSDKLLMLKNAYESGVLSEEEYQKKRAEILEKL